MRASCPMVGPSMDHRGRYRVVRDRTVELAAPLAVDDQLAQAMDDASPTKWHLAPTTWFFERFVLAATRAYEPVHAAADFLWNSYYEGVGERHPRPARSLLTRPTLDEVLAYRREVDARMLALLVVGLEPELAAVVELGCHHEEQHQELLLTDAKHVLWTSPLRPAYEPDAPGAPADAGALAWLRDEGGLVEIGHAGEGFAIDNETPRHRVYLEPFEIASRTVTNAEYLAFIDDGGYTTPSLWVSDGWARVRAEEWTAPLYWSRDARGEITHHTLGGTRALGRDEPVAHVSWYEADAYARWAGARLPTEAEWEHAVARWGSPEHRAHDASDSRHHPRVARASDAMGPMREAIGSVWEWTASPYVPYPRYRPLAGVLGEYNGKFMSSQMVLRGGSCLTPAGHARATYRNFFPPDKRWQMTGIRLARWS